MVNIVTSCIYYLQKLNLIGRKKGKSFMKDLKIHQGRKRAKLLKVCQKHEEVDTRGNVNLKKKVVMVMQVFQAKSLSLNQQVCFFNIPLFFC